MLSLKGLLIYSHIRTQLLDILGVHSFHVETVVLMSKVNPKAGRYKQYKRSRDEEAKVLDQFREPSNPLKFVIVTNKLLTGFDAPILQVMYLDKPMKDHNLLQAICRVIMDALKAFGMIV